MTYCPKCKKSIRPDYRENRYVRWIDLKCHRCGYEHRMEEDELDALQPTSELFDLVYGTNPFEEYEVKAKQKEKEEEKKKEMLEEKYDKMFTKKEDRKFVKDKVLEGK